MTAYSFSMPAGVAGDVSRTLESAVDQAMLVTPFPSAFGVAMKNATGGITPMTTGDAAAVFCGILTRSAPSISPLANGDVGSSVPYTPKVQGLCTRGYVNVICTQGTPVRGNPVYVRVVAAGGKLVGDLEATADGSNNVALTGTLVGNVTWETDGKDAGNIAEIRIAQ